jgi:putative flippase GtrA
MNLGMLRPYFPFLIFCCIGVLNTLVNYSIFLYLIIYMGFSYLHAGSLGFLSGAITGFFLNRKFTFKNSIKISTGLSTYLFLQLGCLIVNSCIQFIVVEYFSVPSKLSQLPAITVTLFLNYIISKEFIFLIKDSNEGGRIKSK